MTLDDADAEIRDLLEHLPYDMRQQLVDAVNRIRASERRGRVRLHAPKPPSDQEQRVLEAFALCSENLHATYDYLIEQGEKITYNRVAYITRKFRVREVKRRRSIDVDNPPPAVLTYLHEAHAAGMTGATIRQELSTFYGGAVDFYQFKKLADAAGLEFRAPVFDVERTPEMIEDVRALERKYGVSMETLKTHFYNAIKPSRMVRERR